MLKASSSPRLAQYCNRGLPETYSFSSGKKESPGLTLRSPTIMGCFPGGPLISQIIGISGRICEAWPQDIKLWSKRGTGVNASTTQVLVDWGPPQSCIKVEREPVLHPSAEPRRWLCLVRGVSEQSASFRTQTTALASLGACSATVLGRGS